MLVGESAAPRMTALFDGFDGNVPHFAARATIPPGPERDALLRYLGQGKMLMRTTARDVDQVEPARGEVVPMSFRSDGTWIWSDGIAYYLRTYGVSPEESFRVDIRARAYIFPEPSEESLLKALDVLKESQFT